MGLLQQQTLKDVQVMNNRTEAQVEEVLALPAEVGAATLPPSDVREGVFHGNALAELRARGP